MLRERCVAPFYADGVMYHVKKEEAKFLLQGYMLIRSRLRTECLLSVSALVVNQGGHIPCTLSRINVNLIYTALILAFKTLRSK